MPAPEASLDVPGTPTPTTDANPVEGTDRSDRPPVWASDREPGLGDAAGPRPTGMTARALRQIGVPHTDLLVLPTSAYGAAILINVLGLFMPLAILQVYDRIIPNASDVTLAALAIMLVVVALIEAVLRCARSYVQGRAAAAFAHNILVAAVGRLLHAPAAGVWNEPASKILDRLDAVGKLGMFFGGTVRQVIVDLPFALLFLAFVALIGGPLVFVPIAVLAVFGFATLKMGGVLGDTLARKDAHDTRAFDFVSEVLSGIATVKGHAMEALMMRRFERLAGRTAELTHDTIMASERAQIMAGMLGNVSMIAIATVGAVLVIDGSMTIGGLAACSMLSGRAVQPVLRFAGLWNEYQSTKLAVADAATIFALPEPDRRAPNSTIHEAPSVSVRDMAYVFAEGERGWRGLDFEIEPGDIACLCGPDGVGKSTLLRLVSGQIEPQQGVVEIAGMPASAFRKTVAQSIGFVSPHSRAFHGTILDNLTLFGAGASPEEAFAAARMTGIEEEIFRFADGYETQIGAGAVESMPRGLVQRILIARALAQRPALLILDEAQSFLDQSSDAKLRECLRDLRLSTTIILVTNRPDYVEMADRVFDLAPGAVTLRDAAHPAEHPS